MATMQNPNLPPDRPDNLASETPIVCTLSAVELRDREAAWLKLGKHISGSAPIAGGLAFTFVRVPGLSASLGELVRLEAECCAWMAFAVDDLADEIHMTVTADGQDGERGVREAFAPLTASNRAPR
jgi:hypothetical protein